MNTNTNTNTNDTHTTDATVAPAAEPMIRIRIERDIDAWSPADWDEPLQLHGPRAVSHFASGELGPLVCHEQVEDDGVTFECGETLEDHPLHAFRDDLIAYAPDEDMCADCHMPRYMHHEWQPDPEIMEFVYVDSRGPYTTIDRVTVGMIRNDPDYYSPGNWGRDSSWLCALVRHPSPEMWWDKLDTDPDAYQSLVNGIVDEWATWFRGDVWLWTVDFLRVCECCGSEVETDSESLGGVYVAESVRESIMEYTAISDAQIEDAIEHGRVFGERWVL